jgi:hypothetical protein
LWQDQNNVKKYKDGGMSKSKKIRRFLSYPGVLIVTTMIIAGCQPNPPARPQKKSYASVSQALQEIGKFAEDTFYACLMNGLAQSLPLAQVSDDCATQLVGPDGRNPGGTVSFPGGRLVFDPVQITNACGSGDPKLGQSSGTGGSTYGGYTYGGDASHYYQYSEEESRQLKEEAIRESELEYQHFKELELKADQAKAELEAAKQAGDAAAIAAAEKKAQEAVDAASAQAGKASEASKKAHSDPNERPHSSAETAPDSACTEVLAAARESLRECNRNGWTSAACQRLAARMHGCPDPTLIYVDPDAGYSCGAPLDAEAVKDAWVRKCESVVKTGPGADSPCKPPKMYGNGRYVQGNSGDVCNDPRAMVDPDSGVCIGTLEVKKPFGQPGIQELIVLALDKIGGPIVVLPLGQKPPNPRNPEPRPGPR